MEEIVNKEVAESLEELSIRHKEESKALLAKVQALKHSVPKGDKKKKKQITAEISALEEELKAKHKAEVTALQESSSQAEVVQKERDTDAQNISKPSRAQKRREKKEAEEKQRQQLIADSERENVNSARNVELRGLKQTLADLNMKISEVAPDGNCLFAAVAVQLSAVSAEDPVKYLRKLAADFMRSHPDEFLPFLIDSETGDIYSEDGYQRYCAEMETTSAWGGQAEIKAMSQALRTPVEIYQANTPTLYIGEEFNQDPVRLSYHRHTYGLGEHYNVVLKRTESDGDPD